MECFSFSYDFFFFFILLPLLQNHLRQTVEGHYGCLNWFRKRMKNGRYSPRASLSFFTVF